MSVNVHPELFECENDSKQFSFTCTRVIQKVKAKYI
jgi:hypothetical protein